MTGQTIMATPWGQLELRSEGGALTGCSWTQKDESTGPVPALLREACTQLRDYLRGTRTTFDLPLAQTGTAFERALWQALARVPYGTTVSYQQLAQAAGYPRAWRALGSALGRNRLVIVRPCHRVVLSSGAPGSYAAGTDCKRGLLQLEAADRERNALV